MLVCKCVCVPVSLCVFCNRKTVGAGAALHLQTPSNPIIHLRNSRRYVSLPPSISRRPVGDTTRCRAHAHTYTHSHRLRSELSTTFLHTFHRAVCLPALPPRVLKGFLGIICVPKRQVNGSNAREKSKLYFFRKLLKISIV